MDYLRIPACLLAFSIVATALTFATKAPSQTAKTEQSMPNLTYPELHDFDFLVGRWHVHHLRLKERLAGNQQWDEFEGSSVLMKTMGGFGTFDDNVIELPGGAYRAMTVRVFDPKDRKWSIWWFDARTPQAAIDPPLRGGFKDGVGTFYSDDTFKGKSIRVRFIWSQITPTSAHWEQAFSPDGGKTWETNWKMSLEREG